MLNIAVVDDEEVHRDILRKYIEEWRLQKRLDVRVETYESSEAFYFMWCEDQHCDVVFLDIMMGGVDGVSLARKLREKGDGLTIIFTTGIADYMQEGYEVEAMHYLLKPLNRKKVWECLDKSLKQKAEDTTNLLLPTEEGSVKIRTDRLLFAEAVERYCVLAYEKEHIKVRIGIRELAQKLETLENFIFCHRSYLINVRMISKISKTDLVMDNGETVPVSRRLSKEVSERFVKIVVGL